MFVRPIYAFSSRLAGMSADVVLGPQDILRDDNPHVVAHPELFIEVRETVGVPSGVESMSARPGEKRNR